jgi:hypothetical protein
MGTEGESEDHLDAWLESMLDTDNSFSSLEGMLGSSSSEDEVNRLQYLRIKILGDDRLW